MKLNLEDFAALWVENAVRFTARRRDPATRSRASRSDDPESRRATKRPPRETPFAVSARVRHTFRSLEGGWVVIFPRCRVHGSQIVDSATRRLPFDEDKAYSAFRLPPASGCWASSAVRCWDGASTGTALGTRGETAGGEVRSKV